MVGLSKECLKFLGFLLIWMLIGPIKVKEVSLETRYHNYVNSQKFKDLYRESLWVAVRPLTWTGERLSALFSDTVKEQEEALQKGR